MYVYLRCPCVNSVNCIHVNYELRHCCIHLFYFIFAMCNYSVTMTKILIMYLIIINVPKVKLFDSNETWFQSKVPLLPVFQESDDTDDQKWRELSKDETVPSGSHVKLDLAGKKKFIKINDENTERVKLYLTKNIYYEEEIKNVLKNVKRAQPGKKKMDGVKVNRMDYRKLEVIINALGEYNFETLTEYGIMEELINNYTKGNSNEKITALTDIEFLVHKFSFAEEFVRLGGIQTLIDSSKVVNSTLVALIAMTLGSAMQGNPPVKTAFLEKEALGFLLYLLKSNVNVIQLRSLFALSAALRNYPDAQDSFISLHGYKVLADILKGPASSDEKLFKKIIILLLDMLDENDPDFYAKHSSDFAGSTLLFLSKRRMALHSALKKAGICTPICHSLYKNYEVLDYVIKVLLHLKETCSREMKYSLFHLHKVLYDFRVNDDTIPPGLFKNLKTLVNYITLKNKQEL